jgi:hypothetical protein
VNAFTQVIRDFHPLDIMRDNELRSKLAAEVHDLKTRAIVSKPLLQHLWAKETPENQAFLVALMKNMSMLCDWSEPNNDGKPRFLVPSLLEFDENVGTLPGSLARLPSPALYFDLNFQKFFLPHGVPSPCFHGCDAGVFGIRGLHEGKPWCVIWRGRFPHG